jgi:hypothetical protein
MIETTREEYKKKICNKIFMTNIHVTLRAMDLISHTLRNSVPKSQKYAHKNTKLSPAVRTKEIHVRCFQAFFVELKRNAMYV